MKDLNMQNLAGFYVAHRKTCARCDGEGWVINEEYERFLERHGSRWRVAAQMRWGEDESRWPQPEIACPECKGEGIATEWVPLEVALEKIKAETL